jgi:hypothetical protein
MAALTEIDLPVDVPLYTLRLTLEGSEFVLRFDYNGKEDRWYLSVYDGDANPIRRGVKIVVNQNVLRQCVHAGKPKGLLIFFGEENPTFSALGRIVKLYYLPSVP